MVFLLFFQYAFTQTAFESVDAWLQTNIEQLGGRAVLMVYRNGEIVFSKSINQLNKRRQLAAKMTAGRLGKTAEAALEDFTPLTRMRIASSSKWLTAALAMTFVDEGKLRLQDTIGKYLPIMSKYGKGQIKVWHCLSNLTGIKQGGLRETIEEWKSFESMGAYVEYIASIPMEGEPGLTFHYGNAGMQIMAAIIEKIGGADFETLFAQRMADPLEMKQTDFGKNGVPLAAGGAWSNAADYMRFLTMR
ncbi:MAG: serine hydrolase domain-containing protein, partial [Chitinophagaceae bacterium]